MKKYLVTYVLYSGNDHYGWKPHYYGEETVEAKDIVNAKQIADNHVKQLGPHKGIKNITEISTDTHETRSKEN